MSTMLGSPGDDLLGIVGDFVAKLKNGSISRKEAKKFLRKENAPDTIIRITRPVKPTYPDWVKKVMHPELEDVGPGEYDPASIDPWLHDGQRNGGRVEGNRIYEDFKRNDSLKICLGLRDGEEIQKKGIAVFRQFFGGKAVFLWKSLVLDSNGDLIVPFLYELGDEVVVSWGCLGSDFYDDSPAARFAS